MLKVRAATVDDADTISSLNDEVQNVHAEALPHLFKPASRETFSAITALARDVGIRRLGLDVWSFNADAIAFFEREGFEIARHIMVKNL